LLNSLYLAFRLVFSTKKGSFSSFASFLAIGGLSIGVASLILTISIVKGFQISISEKLSSFEGEARIQNILGKPFNLNDFPLKEIKKYIDKNEITPFARGIALGRNGSRADGIIIEGVKKLPKSISTNFTDNLDDGEIIIGYVLAKNLGINIGEKLFVQLFQRQDQLNTTNSIRSLIVKGVFHSGLQEFDKTLAYTSLVTAQNIFGLKENQISGIIINNKELNIQMRDVSYPYFYENWQSRHALLFEWINVQKWPAYIMFGLITLVSIINLMAALTMIIQEKTGQIGILLSQGIKFYELKKIFMLMSGFIGLVGTLIGGGLASTVILIQKEFNFLKISSEVYFMDEIPFSFDPFLFFLIIIIILFISIFFSWFPVKILEKVNPSDVLKYE
tara:strand:- start:371 stop:1540 length:1170 start_codon:yes stop_codon:yes gene_type:complete